MGTSLNDLGTLYHQIGAKVDQLATQIIDRSISFESQVPGDAERLLKLSVLNGALSGLEAIALGRPPVVFDTRTVMNIGPLGDLRDAALFCHTPLQLRGAIEKALRPDVRAHLASAWPAALARTFHSLDGRADQRFVEFLRAYALLPERPDHDARRAAMLADRACET